MRKLHTLVAIAAMALLMVPAAAANSDTAITSPGDGEIVVENTLILEAFDPNVMDPGDMGAYGPLGVHWAVVTETTTNPMPCTGTIHFNRTNTPYTFEDGTFSAVVDFSGLPGGEYCFVFNTELENSDGVRIWSHFYVADSYVKVGGVVNAENNPPTKSGNGTHAFEGLVGDAGAAGIVGSITVNYRSLGETVTYEATSLAFRAALGIGAADPMAVAEVGTSDGSTILVLDRDAHGDYPRGAIIVRPDGWGNGYDANFEVDNTPGVGGADSWVMMTHGNNYTGTR